MARTVDSAAHAVRREAFIEAAQRLIVSKGYERMSVQDLLDDLQASKGAFYHYFDSKAALLNGVIDGMVEGAMASVEPLLADPDRTAVDKLLGLFGGIARWKNARQELLVEVLDTWLSDDNAIVREKYRRGVVARLTPILVGIVRQGVEEGSFSVTSPEHSARVFVGLVLGWGEHATDLYVARQAGRIPLEAVEGALAAYPEAFERILGARPGSLPWTDSATLHQWFG